MMRTPTKLRRNYLIKFHSDILFPVFPPSSLSLAGIMSNLHCMKNNIYNPEYVKKLFDKMSPSYDRMNFITSFRFSIRWRRQFLQKVYSLPPEAEIIDLLTGMGESWEATKHRFPQAHLTVLDFSDGMLSYARQKNRTDFNNKIHILQQDILQNDLPDNTYDLVTCSFGLKTFNKEQLSILAHKTKRIMKNGGQFTFIEISSPGNKLLNMLYGFYLGKVIPILGKLFLGNPEDYRMLWKYTTKFRNARAAAEIFAEAGLKTQYISYFYGCATGIYGRKGK